MFHKNSMYYVAFVAVLVAFVVHGWRAYPQLPELMATHFNGEGAADAWSSKASFVWVEAIIAGFLGFLFLGLIIILPMLPIRFINLPNREHWLAGEQRGASLNFLRQRLSMLGLVTFVLLILVNQEIFKANLREPQQLGSDFLRVIIAYFVFIAYWVICLLLRFRKPRQIN